MYCCKVSCFEDIAFGVSFLCSESFIDYLFLGQCPNSQGKHSRPSTQCPTLAIQCYFYLLPQMRLLSYKDQLFIVLAYIILTLSSVPLFQTVSPIPCSTECPLSSLSIQTQTYCSMPCSKHTSSLKPYPTVSIHTMCSVRNAEYQTPSHTYRIRICISTRSYYTLVCEAWS